MKITHLSTSDLGHGAGVAAYRLHRSLLESSQLSQMLVSHRVSSDPEVVEVKNRPRSLAGKLMKAWQEKAESLANAIGPQCVYSSSTKALLHHPAVLNCDVINLHNLHWHNKNFSIEVLPSLTKKAPLVWTLHDMWAFTGHCIYSLNCDRWKKGCGRCPDLESYIPLKTDTTSLLHKLKKKIYQRSRIHFVTPSSWLYRLARESPLLENFEITHIPYGVDQRIYRPQNKYDARRLLGLKTDAPTVIFTASHLNDARKGGNDLEQALINIQDKFPGLQILLLGDGRLSHCPSSMDVVQLGFVQNPRLVALLYAAADLMICPTVADNLPNTVLESLACGTPVVASNVGGVPDMVKHLQNGYLAAPSNAADLAQGITVLLSDAAKRKEMEIHAEKTISTHFSFHSQAESYLNLYRSLTEN